MSCILIPIEKKLLVMLLGNRLDILIAVPMIETETVANVQLD